jgi:L-threonylcarbamoyladenylate synthase
MTPRFFYAPAPMKTRIFRPTAYNISRLAKLLQRGGLVAVPTETVYGLAADALNPTACLEIFRAKDRPSHDPLIVHIANKSQIKSLAIWNETAEKLAQAYWPGPLTMVLPKKDTIPDIVTSGLSSVAIRMPSHAVFRKLLRASNRPLAAPSANPFGYISPTTSQHVKDHLAGRISSILDGGPCPVGVESTIVDLRNPQRPEILRPGSISKIQIQSTLGITVRQRRAGTKSSDAIAAPGQLDRHYSPATPLYLHGILPQSIPSTEAAVLYQLSPGSDSTRGNLFGLTHDGSGQTAARNLFALLRNLDNQQWTKIHMELPPKSDPWHSVLLDRMHRAAFR